MTTHEIIVENKSGGHKTYALFLAPPILKNNPSTQQVYVNVWISRSVPKDAQQTFTIDETFLAWAGQVGEALGPNVTVTGGSSQLVTLGTEANDGSTIPVVSAGGQPYLDGNKKTMTALNTTFQLIGGTDFDLSDNWVFGIAKLGANGRIVPAATFQASPNTTYQIQPVIKYFIAESSAAVGSTINWVAGSTKHGVIDFTSGAGSGKYGAYVVQGTNGLFNVKYEGRAARAFRLQQATLAETPQVGSTSIEELDDVLSRVRELEAYIQKSLSSRTLAGPFAYFCVAAFAFGAHKAMVQIGKHMIDHGYAAEGEVSYQTQADQKIWAKIKFTPPATLADAAFGMQTRIEEDWRQAIESDTTQDGHAYVSVTPATTAEESGLASGWSTQPPLEVDQGKLRVSNGTAVTEPVAA